MVAGAGPEAIEAAPVEIAKTAGWEADVTPGFGDLFVGVCRLAFGEDRRRARAG